MTWYSAPRVMTPGLIVHPGRCHEPPMPLVWTLGSEWLAEGAAVAAGCVSAADAAVVAPSPVMSTTAAPAAAKTFFMNSSPRTCLNVGLSRDPHLVHAHSWLDHDQRRCPLVKPCGPWTVSRE